jgi:hypothetical protein
LSMIAVPLVPVYPWDQSIRNSKPCATWSIWTLRSCVENINYYTNQSIVHFLFGVPPVWSPSRGYSNLFPIRILHSNTFNLTLWLPSSVEKTDSIRGLSSSLPWTSGS